jgi:membrane associated rhomboid family serine protease
VVTLLIVASVLAFIGQTFAMKLAPGFVENYLCLSPGGVQSGYFWQFLTYMFIHGNPGPGYMPAIGVVHLFLNMMTLYFVGREVEAIAGPRHLLGMYFLGGLAGGLAQIGIFPGAGGVTGASAGVCAVLVAFATVLPEFEVTLLFFFVIPVRLRAKVVGVLVTGGAVVMAFTHVMPGVAHMAHFGGCLVGWVYARRLGFGRPWWFQRRIAERRQREERFSRMDPDQYMEVEIDPILDKISREGIRSLTRDERRILERGREKISSKETRISVR